jgi:hypothetical protein
MYDGILRGDKIVSLDARNIWGRVLLLLANAPLQMQLDRQMLEVNRLARRPPASGRDLSPSRIRLDVFGKALRQGRKRKVGISTQRIQLFANSTNPQRPANLRRAPGASINGTVTDSIGLICICLSSGFTEKAQEVWVTLSFHVLVKCHFINCSRSIVGKPSPRGR